MAAQQICFCMCVVSYTVITKAKNYTRKKKHNPNTHVKILKCAYFVLGIINICIKVRHVNIMSHVSSHFKFEVNSNPLPITE